MSSSRTRASTCCNSASRATRNLSTRSLRTASPLHYGRCSIQSTTRCSSTAIRVSTGPDASSAACARRSAGLSSLSSRSTAALRGVRHVSSTSNSSSAYSCHWTSPRGTLPPRTCQTELCHRRQNLLQGKPLTLLPKSGNHCQSLWRQKRQSLQGDRCCPDAALSSASSDIASPERDAHGVKCRQTQSDCPEGIRPEAKQIDCRRRADELQQMNCVERANFHANNSPVSILSIGGLAPDRLPTRCSILVKCRWSPVGRRPRSRSRAPGLSNAMNRARTVTVANSALRG